MAIPVNPANRRHDPVPVLPAYQAIYAQAVEIAPGARVLHISGQIGTSDEGVAAEGFTAQFELAVARLTRVLEGAGMGLGDIVKLTFFPTRAEDLPALGEARRRLLPVRPAVTTLVVAGLAGPDLLVEVEAVAAALASG